MKLIRLSTRTNVIVELDLVLQEYPDLEYDEDMSNRMSGLRVKKIDSDKPKSLSVALDISNRLRESTGIDLLRYPLNLLIRVKLLIGQIGNISRYMVLNDHHEYSLLRLR